MNRLGTQLCPWLTGALEELERAFGAGHFGHGWILAGPAGTGKLNLALCLAMRILTGRTGTAPPAEITPGTIAAELEARYQPRDHHPDLHLVAPEEGKRSIGVDAIRQVIGEVELTAYAGPAKVVVIEPAEAMTVQAANALLKSLEEPAADTYLFLVSHCVGRLPPTVRSRCQTLTVRKPEPDVLARWLAADSAASTHPLIAGDGVGPIDAAQRIRSIDINKYKQLEELLNRISRNMLGPGDAVEQCRGLEPALLLEWLSDRLRAEARRRAGLTNSITDAGAHLTENPWHSLGFLQLLDVYAESERLRAQLATGLNEQLGLEVLFGALSPD